MHDPQPVLTTRRLRLRPFTLADAADVQRLAGAWEIADTTANIPHPYPDGAAENWIAGHAEAYSRGDSVTYAVALRQTEDGRTAEALSLIGAIALSLDLENRHAEMGYWIGVPYWNQGYGTEAAGALLRYGFDTLGLHRIFARHLTRNPASGRIMQKIGMSYEGCQRQHILRWDQFEDLVMYGILVDEVRTFERWNAGTV